MVVINLDRSPDRLQIMNLQSQIMGVEVKRFKAIDGAKYKFTDSDLELLYGLAYAKNQLTLTEEERSKFFKQRVESSKKDREEIAREIELYKDTKYKNVKAEMACCLSHINLCKAYEPYNQPIIILEDDGILCNQFRQRVNETIEHLNRVDPYWDIIWLSGKTPGERQRITKWNGYSIYKMDPPEYIGQGAGAYILSERGKRHFLKTINTSGCSYPIDHFLFKQLRDKHSYGVHPPLVDIHHNYFKTTIQLLK
jgi:GR25 family glycosyltransferase involved in LPS biosynthesis